MVADLRVSGKLIACGQFAREKLSSPGVPSAHLPASFSVSRLPRSAVYSTTALWFEDRFRRSRYELVVVGLVQELQDFLGVPGLLEKPAKGLVAQLARDVFQGPQVIARTIGRRNQQEENADFFSIEAVESDALAADGHGSDQSLHARVFGVRDGDAAADAGAAQLLALHDGLDDAVQLLGLDFSRGQERLGHLSDDAFFVFRREVGTDRLTAHEVCE